MRGIREAGGEERVGRGGEWIGFLPTDLHTLPVARNPQREGNPPPGHVRPLLPGLPSLCIGTAVTGSLLHLRLSLLLCAALRPFCPPCLSPLNPSLCITGGGLSGWEGQRVFY